METYIDRLHCEGRFITGRPQMRRKVKRTLATVGSKTYIVRTVFELDGTTKVFMVPIFLNSLSQGPKHLINRLMDIALEAFDEVRNILDCGASAPLSPGGFSRDDLALGFGGKGGDKSPHSI